MSFASDNWAGASEPVMAALAEANRDLAPAYGADRWTQRARALLDDYFERAVSAFFVATGSAANSLALAHAYRPGGVVLCHVDSHIARDEAGAPAAFAPGLTFDTLDGPAGRIEPEALEARLACYPPGNVHHGRPVALSLTNVNEFGQVYEPGRIAALAERARAAGLAVHVDGARFANALAHTGATPADLTWRAGVDMISLGFTKTGGWCAEAVVVFDSAAGAELAYRHKQAAQLFSKNRFAAAQFVALLEDGHATALAAHANMMARGLADAIAASGGARLAYEPQSNEVFAFLSPAAAERLAAAAIAAHPWASRSAFHPAPPEPGWAMHRFVASFRTTAREVAQAAHALQ